jgi:hypothetical protein
MTGSESRQLNKSDRVVWNGDDEDAGTVIDRDWAGVSVKWDNREQQKILHNDMATVAKV